MKKYKVLRHTNFFAATNEVTLEQLGEFFTRKAIDSFIEYGFLELMAVREWRAGGNLTMTSGLGKTLEFSIEAARNQCVHSECEWVYLIFNRVRLKVYHDSDVREVINSFYSSKY